MYENIKVKDLVEKLDPATIAILHQEWPEIDYDRHTIKEMLQHLDSKTVGDLFAKSLEINYAILAVLTAEVIIDYDCDEKQYRARYTNSEKSFIKEVLIGDLQNAFRKHQIAIGSNLVNVLGFTLLDKCYDFDCLLAKYGQSLSRGVIFMGPEDWLIESAKRSKRIPLIAKKTPWAKAILEH